MSKKERAKLISSVWNYLHCAAGEAYADKNETDFDWYSDAGEVFFQILQGRPIHVTPRVKPL